MLVALLSRRLDLILETLRRDLKLASVPKLIQDYLNLMLDDLQQELEPPPELD